MHFSLEEYVIWSVVVSNILFPNIDTHFEKGSRLQVTESVCPSILYSSKSVEAIWLEV